MWRSRARRLWGVGFRVRVRDGGRVRVRVRVCEDVEEPREAPLGSRVWG